MDKIIVSFTSYPERIGTIKMVLDSLYAQTLKADEIFLWLAEEEFPNKEADLPKVLQDDLLSMKFTLRWCDNLGSHKKYFYAMQEYPDDVIVTVDDDIVYDKRLLETLYQSYLRFPHAVSAHWVSLITFDENGDLLPCSRWVLPYEALKDEPSYQLMAIGSRGILYPPRIASEEVFDKKTILKLCKYKDVVFFNDTWLKIHELFHGVPVVCAGRYLETRRIPKAQYVALKYSEEKASAMGKTEFNIWNKFLNDDSESMLLEEGLSSIKSASSFVASEENAVLKNVECRFRCFLNDNSMTEKDIMSIVHSSLMDLNRLQTFGVSEEKWNKYVRIYQDILSKLINMGKLSTKNFSYYALVNYGVVLLGRLYGDKYKQPAQYENMSNAWKDFLENNPRCNRIYRIGHLSFLQNMKNAMSSSKLRRFLLNKLRSAYHSIKS